MKVCYAASSGGHLEELSQLRELFYQDKDFVLTEKSPHSVPNWAKRVYQVKQINRKEIMFVPNFIGLFFKSLYILLKEWPDVILSTGALATFPISLLGKLAGKKVIYIESFARVDEPSLTGKLMYGIADLFIVQWEELLSVYPNAVYGGAIF